MVCLRNFDESHCVLLPLGSTQDAEFNEHKSLKNNVFNLTIVNMFN